MKNIYLKWRGFLCSFFSFALLALLLPAWLSSNVEAVEGGGAELGRGPQCVPSRGLCSVGDNSNNRQSGDGYWNTQFSVTASGGLSMKVEKAGMSKDDENYQFAGGVFEQVEPVDIPKSLKHQLSGLSMNTIPAGTYPVVENKTHYIIDFSTLIQNQSE